MMADNTVTRTKAVVSDADLRRAAGQDMDAFLQVIADAILQAAGGRLTAESMATLNTDQITLLAYQMLRDEVMDGGYVQLIHNGVGEFIFLNPFAKMMRVWGLGDLAKHVFGAQKLFHKQREDIERDCTDDEFMQLFEQHPEFDDYDDEFVENEEEWTARIAHYVDEHLENFVDIRQTSN